MTKIDVASFETEDYRRIFDILHKRLYNVDWKEWRQSYQALVLLEFLLTHGAVEFAEEFLGDNKVIHDLGSFKYIDDDGFDWGSCMKKKSNNILILLQGGPILEEARHKAVKVTNVIEGFGSSALYSPSCSSTPSSVFSDTSRASSSFRSSSTRSSIWSEWSNELFKSHQLYSPTKSEADESYDGDHYENPSTFSGTSKACKEKVHVCKCHPIKEKCSLLESEEQDIGYDYNYYEKNFDDHIISELCSKLVTLSPKKEDERNRKAAYRSFSDVGMEMRKNTKIDRQYSLWY